MTTAQALNVHEKWFLFDAGEGVQVSLRRNNVPFSKIHHVFVSHMHGDHVLGLPGLIGSMNLLGRKDALTLHGPEPLESWLMENLRLTATYLQFPLKFEVNPPGEARLAWEHSTFQVTAFPVQHRIPTHGFRVDELPRMGSIRREAIATRGLTFEEIRALKSGRSVRAGTIEPNDVCEPGPAVRSYAFAADTRPSARVSAAVAGTTCLYHEATFKADLAARARDTGHSTAEQAAQVASDAGVGQLVIGHFSSRYRDLTPLLAEAQAVFRKTSLAWDGMRIQL
jgi:ribonuclease Z